MPADTATTATLGRTIVTGGASGLGAAVAVAVAGHGGTPYVLDQAPAPVGIAGSLVDVADDGAVRTAVASALDELGGIDAVVTCAAVDTPSDFAQLDTATWERIVRVNLFGTASVIRAALPALERSQGRIVTVASTLGLRTLPAATAYCASKHGIVGFTRALTLELAGRVGVTMLIPGGMDSAFFDGRPDAFKPAADQLLNRPEDVADAVVFALAQPVGCEVRELVITPAVEPSWP